MSFVRQHSEPETAGASVAATDRVSRADNGALALPPSPPTFVRRISLFVLISLALLFAFAACSGETTTNERSTEEPGEATPVTADSSSPSSQGSPAPLSRSDQGASGDSPSTPTGESGPGKDGDATDGRSATSEPEGGDSADFEWADTTPLHRAVYDGDLEKAEELISEGADVDAQATIRVRQGHSWWPSVSDDESLWQFTLTPLELVAVHTDSLPMAALLLEHDADSGISLLLAVHNDSIPMVTLLLEQDTNSDPAAPTPTPTMDYLPRDPLKVAVHNDSLPMATLLLERGADPNAGGSAPVPLLLAVQNDSLPMATILLERGAEPNAIGWSSSPDARRFAGSAIAAAAEYKRTAPVSYTAPASTPAPTPFPREIYHTMGGPPSHRVAVFTPAPYPKTGPVFAPTRDSREDPPPMVVAVQNDSLPMATLLLEHGANPDQESLASAIANDSVPIVSLLLENGAPLVGSMEIAAVNDSSNAANVLFEWGAEMGESLSHAAANDSSAVATFLLDHGADPNSALLDAVFAGSVAMTELLLDHDAGVAHLDVAVAHGFVEVATLLLDRGAILMPSRSFDIRSTDVDGISPSYLHDAVRNDDRAMAALLLDRGHDIEAPATIGFGADFGELDYIHGMTPLHMAALLRVEPATVAFLLDRGANIEARTESASPYYYWPNWPFSVTPLLTAIFVKSQGADEGAILPIAELLLDRGADIDARGSGSVDQIDDPLINTNTPLHGAVARGFSDVTTLLLDRGADTSTTVNDQTPCELARDRDIFTGTPLLGRLCRPAPGR